MLGQTTVGQPQNLQNQTGSPQRKPSRVDLAAITIGVGIVICVIFFILSQSLFSLISVVLGFLAGFILWHLEFLPKNPSLLLYWFREVATMAWLSRRKKEDLFISYDSADVIWKDWITYTLEQEGYGVASEPVKYDGFIEHVSQGDKIARYKMIIWSTTYQNRLGNNTKQHQELEQQKLEVGRRRCILVLVHAGEVHGKHEIKLTGLDESAARKRLLDGVRNRLGKPSSKSSNKITNKPLFPGSSWNVPYFGSNPLFDHENQDQKLSELYDIFIGANERDDLTQPQAVKGKDKGRRNV